MNIANLLVRSGKIFAQNTAIAEGFSLYATYSQVSHDVAVIAGNLITRFNLSPGDRVAIALKNSPVYMEYLFACWHAGLVAVPINAKLSGAEIAYIINDSGARLCIADKSLVALIEPHRNALPLLANIIDSGKETMQHLLDGPPISVIDRSPNDHAWLFYTSGTTGKPKGACLTNRNLMTMVSGFFIDVDSVDQHDNLIHAAPMSHGSGFYILPYVVAGAAQVIPDSGGFDCEEIYSLLKSYRGCSFFAAPTMIHRLINWPCKTDTSNLKSIIYGGGPMYVDECKRAMGKFGHKLIQIYGQGESPMTISVLTRDHHADTNHPHYDLLLASAGVPQAAVEVRIVDEQGSPVPEDITGEIVVRGDSVMDGYWNNPEATAKTIKDGWLHTGDIGKLNHFGMLTLMDRSKDLIISGGSNIYPREIEEVLLQHHAIDEVSVVGKPDVEWGEVIVAFIVEHPGHSVTDQELGEWCLSHIARFKRPRYYERVEKLPKNNYGKVLKSDLRKRL